MIAELDEAIFLKDFLKITDKPFCFALILTIDDFDVSRLFSFSEAFDSPVVHFSEGLFGHEIFAHGGVELTLEESVHEPSVVLESISEAWSEASSASFSDEERVVDGPFQ